MAHSAASAFNLFWWLILALAFAALTHAMPASSIPVGQLTSRDSSPANLTCRPNDIAIDTTAFVEYAAAFCTDITTIQATARYIPLVQNHTLALGVISAPDAVKCQVDSEICANAMQLIRKTCKCPFPRELVR
jgi:hypothetical protein